ncbi:MAG: carbohydrate-binding family 9-like protein [Kiritimatiellae bacterium]|nr:carbohydrate-binding family 9-like protein [Kiritimatiellia bacterium]
MEYVITRADQRPSLKGLWDEAPWHSANVISLTNFLSQSKSRHPRVEVKVVYQDEGMFVFFRVFDKFVRCVRTSYQGSVYKDSCVEFFVEPRPGRGYFNFEINGGGTLLLFFQEQLPGQPGARTAYKRHNVPWELGRQVVIYHSLPPVVDPEIGVDTEWRIEYFIPFTIFERYLGPLGPVAGQVWRANFYKCGDETSHPHWVSWAPLGPEFSFHLPQYFAPISFLGK